MHSTVYRKARNVHKKSQRGGLKIYFLTGLAQGGRDHNYLAVSYAMTWPKYFRVQPTLYNVQPSHFVNTRSIPLLLAATRSFMAQLIEYPTKVLASNPITALKLFSGFIACKDNYEDHLLITIKSLILWPVGASVPVLLCVTQPSILCCSWWRGRSASHSLQLRVWGAASEYALLTAKYIPVPNKRLRELSSAICWRNLTKY